MKLSHNEKQVLTLLDDAKVDCFEKWAQKYVHLPENAIKKIVDKLKKLELIEMISLSNEKDLYYFHTRKVNREMLDDDLRYKRDYGSDKPILASAEKLERKFKKK